MKARISTLDGFIEAEVFRIVTIEGRKAFIHTTEDDEGDGLLYKITDWESGFGMSTYQDSPAEAIAQATKACLRRNPTEVKSLADAAIAIYGRANE